MNPSQKQPTNKEFLDGELSNEELKKIAAAGVKAGLYIDTSTLRPKIQIQ